MTGGKYSWAGVFSCHITHACRVQRVCKLFHRNSVCMCVYVYVCVCVSGKCQPTFQENIRLYVSLQNGWLHGLKEEQSYYSKAFCAAPAKLQSNTLIITLYDLEKVNSVYIKVALATNLVSV